jgi:hypothetical protein
MKPTPQQPVKGTARKRKPASVLFLHESYNDDDRFVAKKPYSDARGCYGIWIPCSLKSARARKKWEALSREEKVRAIASKMKSEELSASDYHADKQAAAALAAMEGGG